MEISFCLWKTDKQISRSALLICSSRSFVQYSLKKKDPLLEHSSTTETARRVVEYHWTSDRREHRCKQTGRGFHMHLARCNTERQSASGLVVLFSHYSDRSAMTRHYECTFPRCRELLVVPAGVSIRFESISGRKTNLLSQFFPDWINSTLERAVPVTPVERRTSEARL